ncbi:hypothetical protein ACOSQ2_021795 [Xanthoceras sorbifolium]
MTGIALDGSRKATTMLLRYERLPELCSQCGLIGHTMRECLQGSRDLAATSKKAEYVIVQNSTDLLHGPGVSQVEILMVVDRPEYGLTSQVIASGLSVSTKKKNWKRVAQAKKKEEVSIGLCGSKRSVSNEDGSVGSKIALDGSRKATTMLLRYERLPELCSQCGLIGHTMRECLQGSRDLAATSKKAEYVIVQNSTDLLHGPGVSQVEILMVVDGPEYGLTSQVTASGLSVSTKKKNWKRVAQAKKKEEVSIGLCGSKRSVSNEDGSVGLK